MSNYFKFKNNDKIVNYITSYPYYNFSVYGAKVYLNSQDSYSGSFTDKIGEVPSGHVSLYEMNVDRDFSAHTYDSVTDTGIKSKIFPFITKDSALSSFGTVTTNSWNQFSYGDIITGSYPLSSSIVREFFNSNHGSLNPSGSHMLALKNTLNYYTPISNHYAFSSSLGDKAVQKINLISVPSIFFGKKIKKGSVKLNYYLSGAIVATLEDVYKNGTLVQTAGSEYAQSQGSGSVAGVVLYNEGFMVITGAWGLSPTTYAFGDVGTPETPKWLNFAIGCNDGVTDANITPSASFEVNFRGTSVTPNMTLFAHANKNELNYSNNPTYIDKKTKSQTPFSFSSSSFIEQNDMNIKNTISSSFSTYSGSFKKQTFISKMGIYDSNKNLIAIVNLARPVRKKESDEYTFKINLDI
ncbi:hypothetical protein [Phenylobacterium sp.]|uniref:hypothetical protein n=1 Tax=Phenylobacterium sp. TaxID=1871053 RepID=UPI0025EEF2D6|nr:hypothetical protein [Phenylobacterium sp.]